MGVFAGKYWMQPYKGVIWLFIPDPWNPFTFTTNSGVVIKPEDMLTDGASIPRFLWGVPGMAPWDWPDAVIIHDWLYETHHRGRDVVGFSEANAILGEAMDAMKAPPLVRDAFVWASNEFGLPVWNRPIF